MPGDGRRWPHRSEHALGPSQEGQGDATGLVCYDISLHLGDAPDVVKDIVDSRHVWDLGCRVGHSEVVWFWLFIVSKGKK